MKTDHLLEKGSGLINEDTLVMDGTLFGVFDGATSLDRNDSGNRETGGLIASDTASRVFARNGDSLVNLARHANSAILRRMIENGVDCSRRENLWSTSAAVVRFQDTEMEWIQTGDCPIILVYRDAGFRVLGGTRDHDYETLSMWKDMALSTTQTIREALEDQICKTRAGMNRTYGVLNGEKEAESFLYSGNESLEGVTDVLLFTDGLTLPSPRPEQHKSYDALVGLYRSLGLKGLREHIRTLEQTDPQCRHYPRFKCHDDIAAISIHTGS
ncbi:MAG: protein phosphatase 2C domain-containing protein [Pseudomonadota bacterium]